LDDAPERSIKMSAFDPQAAARSKMASINPLRVMQVAIIVMFFRSSSALVGSDKPEQRQLALSNREVLSKLYSDTSGASWTNHLNWMKLGNPCPSGAWFGVTCSSAKIIGLDFSQNLLVGTIPSELGMLSALTNIELDGNSLTGSIPSELGKFSRVSFFFALSRNSFTGFIPSELGRLTALREQFLLHNNALSGSIPSQLGLLTGLTTKFELLNNNLCGDIPAEVSALSSQVATFTILSGNGLGTDCLFPSPAPTIQPTPHPTDEPTPHPTDKPTPHPTDEPTSYPTPRPSSSPTSVPTPTPSSYPSAIPSASPTSLPTNSPTYHPSIRPTHSPTTIIRSPTPFPTSRPTQGVYQVEVASECVFSGLNSTDAWSDSLETGFKEALVASIPLIDSVDDVTITNVTSHKGNRRKLLTTYLTIAYTISVLLILVSPFCVYK
jgi:hypothetical protein